MRSEKETIQEQLQESVFDLGTKRKTNGAYSSGICLVFNQNSCKLCFFAARQHSFILLEIAKGRYIGQKNFMASFIRDHSFSTYANFSKKLTFRTLLISTPTCACQAGVKKC